MTKKLFAMVMCAMTVACSASDKRVETGLATCVAQDALAAEHAIATGTFTQFVNEHGAEFALCAMRAWSSRNAAAVAAPTTPTTTTTP